MGILPKSAVIREPYMKEKTKKSRGGAALSFRSVLLAPRQYLIFIIASIIIQTLFLTLLIGAEVNRKNSHSILSEKYDCHIILSGVSEQSYTGLKNYTTASELWPEITYIRTVKGNVLKIKLAEKEPYASEKLFFSVSETDRYGISLKYSSIDYTPLYTDDPEMNRSGATVQTVLCVLFLAVAAVTGRIYHSLNHRKVRSYTDPEDREYRSTMGEGARLAASRVLSVLTAIFACGSLVCFLLLANQGNKPVYFLIYLAAFAICTAFMTTLFSMRINHYKYRYGLYMAFGAGFSRLYRIGASELAVISLLTFLPSAGMSALMLFLLYGARGVSLTASLLPALLKFVIIDLLIVLVSTYLPVKKIAVSTPVGLLTAQDNSNLVSSPRRSFDMGKKSFPTGYGIAGMKRFRKYFTRLVATAVSFTVIFLCGMYIARMIGDTYGNDTYEFLISADSAAYTVDEEELGIIIDEIESDPELAGHIKYLYWNDETKATSKYAHALLPESAVSDRRYAYSIRGLGNDRYGYLDGGYPLTTDYYKFVSFDEHLISAIEKNSVYSVEGDLSSVLTEPDTIIISESIRSIPAFNFNVGDKIVIATPGEFMKEPDESVIQSGDRRMILEKLLKDSYFNYKVYTVGAIVDYAGNDDCIMIGMGADEYRKVTGKVALHNEIRVYMNEDSYATADLDSIKTKLSAAVSLYSYSVSETYNLIRSRITTDENHYGLIIFMSVAVMLVSPMIWFFSQSRFIRRRDGEIYILSALGAKRKGILRLFITEGLVLACLSSIATLALGFAADLLIYLLCATFVPTLGNTGGVVFRFYMPPEALILCLLTAFACGFLSSWLPGVFASRMNGDTRKDDL